MQLRPHEAPSGPSPLENQLVCTTDQEVQKPDHWHGPLRVLREFDIGPQYIMSLSKSTSMDGHPETKGTRNDSAQDHCIHPAYLKFT